MPGNLGRTVAWGLVLVLSACEQRRSAADEPRSATTRLEGIGHIGALRFELELEPDPPVVGELFRVVTTVRYAETGTVVENASFELDADMPAHGHGMATRPEHRSLGGGRYLSEGMKFHMPGRWELRARAVVDGTEDAVALPFDQPVSGR